MLWQYTKTRPKILLMRHLKIINSRSFSSILIVIIVVVVIIIVVVVVIIIVVVHIDAVDDCHYDGGEASEEGEEAEDGKDARALV